jgi:hypothetical protein
MGNMEFHHRLEFDLFGGALDGALRLSIYNKLLKVFFADEFQIVHF